MIQGFSFVELPVQNFDNAVTFYQDTLGLQLSHMDDVRKWCLFKIPGSGTGVALYQSPEGLTSREVNHSVHVVAQVENLEETIEDLSAKGVEIESVRIHEDEHFHISGFRDPDGNVWRIWAPLR